MSTALQVRVSGKRLEALDICAFELVGAQGGALPPFDAGSHIDVRLPGGLVRQYSLCNPPHENHRYVIGVLKDPASRGGSRTMHEDVKEGDLLQVSAPKNHFRLEHTARRSLLLAGGIGVTPILCMAEKLAAAGAAFEFHYCTRSRERTAFHERIQASPFARQTRFYFDEGGCEERIDLPALLAGPAQEIDVDGVHLYVCGPKGFIDAVLRTARANRWPEANLHFEFFAGEAALTQQGGSFRVKLARSGRLVQVPANRTVVQALADAGVEVSTSCEQGVCGTCLTRVLEGECDHRDMYLTPEEQAANDQFTPCCSRSRSPVLVLDL
jgi:vanillate O-demethylase ferredoxin subunit